jgi:hypothetical protein
MSRGNHCLYKVMYSYMTKVIWLALTNVTGIRVNNDYSREHPNFFMQYPASTASIACWRSLRYSYEKPHFFEKPLLRIPRLMRLGFLKKWDAPITVDLNPIN